MALLAKRIDNASYKDIYCISLSLHSREVLYISAKMEYFIELSRLTGILYA